MKPTNVLVLSLGCFALAAAVFVFGAWALRARWRGPSTVPAPCCGPGAAEGEQGAQPAQGYESAGERIYLDGLNAAGNRIPFTGGPHWLAMHGGSCAACHGRDGRGGRAVRGSSDVAPDIRYRTLTTEEEEHGEAGQHEHERYTDADIKRAITKGIEPDGASLSRTMPRFQMSEDELNDLLAHLKELDGHE